MTNNKQQQLPIAMNKHQQQFLLGWWFVGGSVANVAVLLLTGPFLAVAIVANVAIVAVIAVFAVGRTLHFPMDVSVITCLF